MTRLADSAAGDRFPGLDVMSQASHWDDATAAVVSARLGMPPDIRFFSPHEEATAGALCDQLLDQHEGPWVPVVNMVDHRLTDRETDGWHYDDMPHDAQAWRDSLAALDQESRECWGADFADASREEQAAILQVIQRRGSDDWRGVRADRLWSLWTRYACTAFYSHPWAWDEIGFAGPAYPRGYKNIGIDRLEPFEVPDAHPTDPTRHPSSPGQRKDESAAGQAGAPHGGAAS